MTKKKLDVNEFMEERGKSNSMPYEIPAKLKQKYNITKAHSLPVDTYMLKSKSRSGERIVLYLPGGGYVEQSPWLDITLSNPEVITMIDKEPMLNWNMLVESGKRYAGETPRSHYLLSPIHGEIKNLGNISLFIGTHELFLPDARKFKEKAIRQSVDINYFEYPKMNHVFPVFPIPEAKKALKQMVDIIQSRGK